MQIFLVPHLKFNAVFKDFNKVNFINLNSDHINLEKIQITNEKISKKSNTDKIAMINELRDSFRVIKHSLTAVNNSLEASKFHRLELYAKEIELECKLKDNCNKKDDIRSNKKYNPDNYKKLQLKKFIKPTVFIVGFLMFLVFFNSDF
ncbi:MAG: hypothetical protein MR902_08950 [Campylobacter sp.]|nr:hypothetical protein [Campylobacter sp.]